MALNDFTCSALIGGTSGTLDKISSLDGLQNNDRAKVLTSDGVYWYIYNESGTDTEDGYLYIEPDSESGCWYLVGTTIQPYDIGGTFNGSPTSNLVILRYPIPREVTFPASLTLSLMIANTAATAETVFSLQKNDVEFGTATFAASGTSATFAAASDTTFSVGDILTIVSPSTPDATLADLGWAIVGIR